MKKLNWLTGNDTASDGYTAIVSEVYDTTAGRWEPKACTATNQQLELHYLPTLVSINFSPTRQLVSTSRVQWIMAILRTYNMYAQ